MRAALLLSALILICGVAVLFGVPSVQIRGQPLFGIAGLAIAMIGATFPPAAVFAWRKLFLRNGL
jgi:hypothetical protein